MRFFTVWFLSETSLPPGDLKQDVFFLFIYFCLEVHLQSISINTPHAHSLLLGGHLYFCTLFISLARDPVIK